RGATCTAVATYDRRDELAWRRGRSAVLVRLLGDGSADALDEDPLDFEDPIEALDPRAHLVADLHVIRRLDRITVDAHVPAADRRRGGRARLVHAHGPKPHVDAHGSRVCHAIILSYV